MSLPSAFDAGVVAALSALDAKSVKYVFFVACGGSLSIMHPAKFLLDQHAPLPSDVYNAAEFVARAPRSLDRNALVILCSMTGTTKETTAAAEFARSKGATTIGLTVQPASPSRRRSTMLSASKRPTRPACRSMRRTATIRGSTRS